MIYVVLKFSQIFCCIFDFRPKHGWSWLAMICKIHVCWESCQRISNKRLSTIQSLLFVQFSLLLLSQQWTWTQYMDRFTKIIAECTEMWLDSEFRCIKNKNNICTWSKMITTNVIHAFHLRSGMIIQIPTHVSICNFKKAELFAELI